MPSPPRIVFSGTTVMITTRVEEGLPFACNGLMEAILWSCLARAQELHPMQICHIIVMGNHIHIIAVVKNPDDVKGFMERFKTESAHAVNRLLGRRKRTVWCDGYDCVPILTVEDVIEKIVYVYTNPQQANLVDSIQEYPGLSSWELYINQNNFKTVARLKRSDVIKLSGVKGDAGTDLKALREKSTGSHSLLLFPDAWMDLFGVTEAEEQKLLRARIITSVKDFEDELAASRRATGRKCLGAALLRGQSIATPFTPKKFAKRMYCICSDVLLRIQFIQFIKSLIKAGREVRDRWKLGDYSIPYPLGLFPPSMPKLGNLLPENCY